MTSLSVYIISKIIKNDIQMTYAQILFRNTICHLSNKIIFNKMITLCNALCEKVKVFKTDVYVFIAKLITGVI